VSAVIEVEGLRKEYFRLIGKRTLAVAGLDLSVPEGGVFGFLGPNGSGKTTTIRCLLGLVRPTAGSCRVLGASRRDLWHVSERVGSIVESPSLFPTFSGRENLTLIARLFGVGDHAVTRVLERVGLADRAKDLVKTYSLGMKQRLALAAAILKDPALLILDEPANGLDPAGIKEVRDLLRGLALEGRTVFVSSHQLSEVQQVCARVAILSRGRCIASGTVSDVLNRGRSGSVLVRIDRPEAALEAFAGAAPDLALIDFAMPSMNGAQLARALRERRPDLPIAFVTGYAESDQLEGALGPEVPVLRKPFEAGALLAMVRGTLLAGGQ
jgi:ABC-2 type transport system ATP-binding protein